MGVNDNDALGESLPQLLRVRSACGHSSLLWQVVNSISAKFYLRELGLDLSGVLEAIGDFMKDIGELIKTAVNKMLKSVKDRFQGLLDDISGVFGGRRLEEFSAADFDRVHELMPQAHRQLIEVQGRLLQVGHADNSAFAKDQLLLDVHRRLEAHVGKRQLEAPQHGENCGALGRLARLGSSWLHLSGPVGRWRVSE